MSRFDNKLKFYFTTTSFLILLQIFSISGRDEKLLPFFALVRIPNQICQSNNGQYTGVCYSRRQCERVGGVEGGRCAAGYGTCCLVTNECTSGEPTRVHVNGTHLVNPGTLPSPNYCQYIFPKKKNVCQVRLDFVKFVIADAGIQRHCDTDTLTLDGASNTKFMGQLCGNLTGQHVYLDYGTGSEITVDIFTASRSGQQWDIKVTYIKCDSTELAPEGCLQYFTEPSGIVQSFNFNNLQQTNYQDYSVCVKSFSGMNKITWSICGDQQTDFIIAGLPPIFPPPGGTEPPLQNLGSGSDCLTDWVMVFGANKYCGNDFPTSVPSMSKPFLLQVHFDGNELTQPETCVEPYCRDDGNTGFCLMYSQSP